MFFNMPSSLITPGTLSHLQVNVSPRTGHGRLSLDIKLDEGLFTKESVAATRPEDYSCPNTKNNKVLIVLEAGREIGV